MLHIKQISRKVLSVAMAVAIAMPPQCLAFANQQTEDQKSLNIEQVDSSNDLNHKLTAQTIAIQSTIQEAEKKPLSDIVDQASVILYDENDNIVSSNDADYYPISDDYLSGGSLNLGDGTNVRILFKSIKRHDGSNGIQEDTTYTLVLPNQLIPQEETSGGVKLVDPDEPIEFIKQGELSAVGGIYKDGSNYELRLMFNNVENALNISGEFQYGAKVSDDLAFGSTQNLDYGSIGSISFKVQDGTGQQESGESYKFSLKFNQPDNNQLSGLFYKASFKSVEDNKLPEDSKMTIELSEGNAFRKLGSTTTSDHSLFVTYLDGTTSGLIGTWESGKIKFKDESNTIATIQPENWLYYYNSQEDPYNGLFGKMSLTLESGVELKEINLDLETFSWNDYGSNFEGGVDIDAYKANGVVKFTSNSEEQTLSSSDNYIKAVYSPYTDELADPCTYEPNYTNSINGLPTYFKTHFSFMQGNSSIISFKYSPGSTNTLDVHYAVPSKSFFNNYLVNDYSRIFDRVLDRFTIDGLNFGTNFPFIMQSDNPGGGDGYIASLDDPEFAYKLNKLFNSDKNNDGIIDKYQIVIHKSVYKYNGKYVYVVIEPDQMKKATTSVQSGANAYGDKISETGKFYFDPCDWNLLIFNAPNYKQITLEFNELIQRINTPNNTTNHDGVLENKITLDAGVNNHKVEKTTKYESNNKPNLHIEGQIVDKDITSWELKMDVPDKSVYNSVMNEVTFLLLPKGVNPIMNADLIRGNWYAQNIYSQFSIYDYENASWGYGGSISTSNKYTYEGFDTGVELPSDYNVYQLVYIPGFLPDSSGSGGEAKIQFFTEGFPDSGDSKIEAKVITSYLIKSGLGIPGIDSSYSPTDLIKTVAEGIAYVPSITKSGRNVESDGDKLYQEWEINCNSADEYDQNGAGYISFSDEMYAKKRYTDEKLQIGTLSDIESMEISLRFKGENDFHTYTLTQDDLSDLESTNEFEKTINGSEVKITKDGTKLEKGFAFEASGAKNLVQMKMLLNTSFDYKSYMEDNGIGFGDLLDIDFNNDLKNLVYKNEPPTQASATIKYDTTAKLGVSKPAPVDIENDVLNQSKNYTLKTVVNSNTSYVRIEDFISGYSNVDKDGNILDSGSDQNVLDSIAKNTELSNIKIEVREQLKNKESVIYNNQSILDNNWIVELAKHNDSTNNLFSLVLKHSDGSNISPQTEVIITYKTTIDFDSTGIRELSLYEGGGFGIVNNAVSSSQITPDQSDIPTTDTDGQYGPYDNLVDNTNNKLICYAGSGSFGEYLSYPTFEKSLTSDEDSGFETSWEISCFTGSTGKSEFEIQIKDVVEWNLATSVYNKISSSYRNLRKSGLESLLNSNTYYKDISLYYGDDENHMTLIGKIDGKLNQQKTVGTNPSFTIKPNENSFELKVNSVDQNKYLRVYYSVYVDYTNFFEQAKSAGHMKSTGYVSNASYVKLAASCTNTIKDGDNNIIGFGDSSEVSTSNISTAKNLISRDNKSYTSNWEVASTLGDLTSNKIKITDTLTITSNKTSLNNLIKEAMVYKDIKIKIDDQLIYDETSDDLYANGYNSSNFNISKSNTGISFEISSKDGDNFRSRAKVNMTYTIQLDTELYFEKVGLESVKINQLNKAVVETGGSTSSATSGVGLQPDFNFELDKKSLDEGDKKIATWEISTNTGYLDRENLVIKDAMTIPSELEGLLSLSSFDIEIKNGEAISNYNYNNLPAEFKLLKNDSDELINIDENGFCGFDLKLGSMPKNTNIKIDYVVSVDRDYYLNNGGKENSSYKLKNDSTITADDGCSGSSSSEDIVEIPFVLLKTGEFLRNNSEGNPVFKWCFDVDLLAELTEEELNSADEVYVTDELNPLLDYTIGSVKVYDSSHETTSEVPSDKYSVSTEGNVLKIKLNKPFEYTNLQIEFETESEGAVRFSNTANVYVGSSTWSSKEDNPKNYKFRMQYGMIRSIASAKLNLIAYKYIDGELVNDDDHVFTFSATEVDADKNVIADGYNSISNNDNTGKISFDEIEYSEVGQHFYLIKEIGIVKTEDQYDYNYTLDNREFLVKVDVQLEDQGFVVSDSIVSPNSYDSIKFDNSKITTRDLLVEKVWNNGDSSIPDSITVKLLNNGVPYNNMTATISSANNWKYTFVGLPIADGNYTVEEVPVPGYSTTYSTTTKQDDHWKITVTNDKRTITPPPTAPGVGSLVITKNVVGKDSDTNKLFTFNIKINPNITGKYGDVEFASGVGTVSIRSGESARLTNLPANCVYSIEEQDYSSDGYELTSSTGSQGTILENKELTAEFTNSYTAKTSTKVEKIWEDEDNKSNKRPESITVVLFEKHDSEDQNIGEYILSEENGWGFEVSGIDKYDSFGNVIERYWVEKEVPEGYELKEEKTEDSNTIITNKLKETDPPDNTPGEPGKPDDPEKPDKPEKPDNHGKPDEPEKPEKPGKPEDPGTPDKPNTPPDNELNKPDKDGVPQTGDNLVLFLLITTTISSAIVSLVACKKMR